MYLKPDDMTTMRTIMLKVALSPVAMLMIARMLRRILKGLNAERKRRTRGVTGAVEERTFGPWAESALETSSAKSPVGLEEGRRLEIHQYG